MESKFVKDMERKEALKVVKKNWPDSSFTMLREALETLIPELKESEDKKWIPKEIIKYLKEKGDFRSCWIAWLEKQQCRQKHTEEYNITGIGSKHAEGKLGEMICNLKPLGETMQKPVFEIKTPEESLGIDSDTYNKIVDECIYGDDDKKPAWSEEEEVKINRIVTCLENLNVADSDILLKDIDWLKSLKDRYAWKPSDKQMTQLGKYCPDNRLLTSLYEQLKKLKSLKPQNTWKPSDEQIAELRKYSDNLILRNLYYNLKKLKG